MLDPVETPCIATNSLSRAVIAKTMGRILNGQLLNHTATGTHQKASTYTQRDSLVTSAHALNDAIEPLIHQNKHARAHLLIAGVKHQPERYQDPCGATVSKTSARAASPVGCQPNPAGAQE